MAVWKALITAPFLASSGSAALAAHPYSSPYDGALSSAYLGLRGSIIDGADSHATASAVDLRAHYSTAFGGAVYAGTWLGYGSV